MDKREMAFENFKNIQDLIRFIDQKAGALLILYGFILTSFIEYSKKLKFVNPISFNDNYKSILSVLTLLVGLVLILLIIYQFYIIIILILKPRGAKHYLNGETSLFYNEHISLIGKQQFVQQFSNMDEEKLTEDLLGQVFEVSKILEHKSKNFSKTTSYILLTGILLLFYIFFSYLV